MIQTIEDIQRLVKPLILKHLKSDASAKSLIFGGEVWTNWKGRQSFAKYWRAQGECTESAEHWLIAGCTTTEKKTRRRNIELRQTNSDSIDFRPVASD